METKTILRIQAFLDNELPGRECAQIEQLLQSDVEAQQLYEGLKAIKTGMADQDTLRSVPASREFYWNGIAREIQPVTREESGSTSTSAFGGLMGWIPRFLVPVAALALLTLLVVRSLDSRDEGSLHLAIGHEVEIPLDETISFTFRSESELMTVVWVDTGSFSARNADY